MSYAARQEKFSNNLNLSKDLEAFKILQEGIPCRRLGPYVEMEVAFIQESEKLGND